MISAIVCTYNRCESLRDTLRALQAQRFRDGLTMEILVVDNNSTDQTQRVVHEASWNNTWPIRYVFEPQQGLSHARNRGIQEAHSDVIAFTDDDAVPDPHWAQALHAVLVSSGADCAGGRIVPLWMATPPRWLFDAVHNGQFLAVFSLLDAGPEVVVAKDLHRGVAYGANMGFRKTVFAEVGLFSTHLGPIGLAHLLGDDTEMVERVFLSGKRVVYTPHAVVHHKIGPERMRKNYIRKWKYSQGLTQAISATGNVRTHEMFGLSRTCCGEGLRALLAYGRGHQARGMVYEASFWTQLGRLVGTTKLLQQNSCENEH